MLRPPPRSQLTSQRSPYTTLFRSPPTTALTGDRATDVAVVGGGYTGRSAALHLAEAGAGVSLLEAAEVGFGGAGRNVGLVNAGLWVMPNDLLTTLDAPYGERLLEQLGDAPRLVFDLIESLGIDCEATQTGTLHCAAGKKGWNERSEENTSELQPQIRNSYAVFCL